MLKVGFDIKKLPFDKLSKDMVDALGPAMKRAMLFASAESKKRFDTPGNLKVQTGTLRRSISSIVEEQTTKVTGSIFTNVIYGPPHELGLVMTTRAGSVYKMPQRPFLRPAIEENLDKIENIILNYLVKELN